MDGWVRSPLALLVFFFLSSLIYPVSCPSRHICQTRSPERLSRARAFLDTHRKVLTRIEDEYGVPKEVEVAILLVETDLGRYLGSGRAFNILASMAAATDIDSVKPWLSPELLKSAERERLEKKLRDKSRWAYEELRALLIYSRQNQIDLLEIKGSIFGAIGLCQFMPSNALRFGIDQDHLELTRTIMAR